MKEPVFMDKLQYFIRNTATPVQHIHFWCTIKTKRNCYSEFILQKPLLGFSCNSRTVCGNKKLNVYSRI